MGRVHDTRRCAKRTCCRSGKGRFAACSERNSTGIFFSLHIYSSIQALKKTFLYLDQWTQYDQTIFFSLWKCLRGRLLPYFCSEKRPGYVVNAPGALFRNCFMIGPGVPLLRSLRCIACYIYCCWRNTFLKKNQNMPGPSEHPPVRGEKVSKRLLMCFCVVEVGGSPPYRSPSHRLG